MRNFKRDIGVIGETALSYFNYLSSLIIISQEREKMNEDASLFRTCTSYSHSYNDDAELSDNQREVSLTRSLTKSLWCCSTLLVLAFHPLIRDEAVLLYRSPQSPTGHSFDETQAARNALSKVLLFARATSKLYSTTTSSAISFFAPSLFSKD